MSPPTRLPVSMLDEIKPRITARLVREYIRAELVEPMVQRAFEIGMGITKFDTPTAAGNVVAIEATAAVQVQALLGLTALGVPTQLGLVDDDGATLPGVVALGELEMITAQEMALGGRFASVAQALGENGNGVPRNDEEASAGGPGTSPVTEFEIVEVDEVQSAAVRTAGDVAPGPINGGPTPEQLILARRRARRTNGK